jgi:hypothetical protein
MAFPRMCLFDPLFVVRYRQKMIHQTLTIAWIPDYSVFRILSHTLLDQSALHHQDQSKGSLTSLRVTYNFKVKVFIDHNVFRFQVSVHDSNVVHVL